MSDDRLLDPTEWQAKHALIARHLEDDVAGEPWVQTVEYDAEIPRWYVRFGCDGRDAATIYFDLHQRTLRYEVYFMPDPPAHHEELYRFLLARNHHDVRRALLDRSRRRHAISSVACCSNISIVDELDRIIGVLYELVERWFQPAIRLGFARI